MRRQTYHVREGLKKFWQDDTVLSSEAFGIMAGKILLEAFGSMKAGEKEDEIIEKTLARFSDLLDTYAAGERKVYWQEMKRLFDAGAIKKAAFIDYLMSERGFTHLDAVKYVAETFGMKESTQSVYLSEEFNLRQKEKGRKKKSEGS